MRAGAQCRALARDSDVDLTTLAETGPRGRVQAQDVRVTAQAAPAPAPVQTGGLSVTRSRGGTGDSAVLIHGAV